MGNRDLGSAEIFIGSHLWLKLQGRLHFFVRFDMTRQKKKVMYLAYPTNKIITHFQ